MLSCMHCKYLIYQWMRYRVVCIVTKNIEKTLCTLLINCKEYHSCILMVLKNISNLLNFHEMGI